VPMLIPGDPPGSTAQGSRELAWLRLPNALASKLASVGVTRPADLLALSQQQFSSLTGRSIELTEHRQLIECFRLNPFDYTRFLQKLMKAPRGDASSVLTALGGASASTPSVPSQSLRLLSAARQEGVDIHAVLDGISDSRAGCAVAQSTGKTYDSHLNQVRWACDLLCAPLCPTTLATVRRVAAIVNNTSTLRGWLSAWRQLHIMARTSWPGDGDSFLLAARLGLAKLNGPPPLRKRMRRARILLVLKSCVERNMHLEGAAVALAYIFGLRVPSELLRQATTGAFVLHGARKISFGPIKRKCHPRPSTLSRFCTCSAEPLLCAHPWIAALRELQPTGKCFSFSAVQLMTKLKLPLLASGIKEEDLSLWTSHCFRRGSGIDVLEDRGVKAMLAHGEWSDPRSASPYASADEQKAVAFAAAQLVLNASDDDE
jgi:hypothetical protein